VIDRISNTALMNEHHQNVQAIFFSDDDDGKASFAFAFIETFNKPEWTILRKGMYVEILSKNKKVRIVARYPGKQGTRRPGCYSGLLGF
jgi:hypothetical protein